MSECGLFWVGETLFWVSGGAWGCMGHYFGQVGMSGGKWGVFLVREGWVGHYFRELGVGGTLFWVGGGGWGIIFDEWGWVGMSGAGWG